MTLLQEWLGATIDTEQKAALEWKRQQLRGELPANTRHHRFEDESGNLRVKCVKEGVLQIIKVRAHHLSFLDSAYSDMSRS